MKIRLVWITSALVHAACGAVDDRRLRNATVFQVLVNSRRIVNSFLTLRLKLVLDDALDLTRSQMLDLAAKFSLRLIKVSRLHWLSVVRWRVLGGDRVHIVCNIGSRSSNEACGFVHRLIDLGIELRITSCIRVSCLRRLHVDLAAAMGPWADVFLVVLKWVGVQVGCGSDDLWLLKSGWVVLTNSWVEVLSECLIVLLHGAQMAAWRLIQLSAAQMSRGSHRLLHHQTLFLDEILQVWFFGSIHWLNLIVVLFLHV